MGARVRPEPGFRILPGVVGTDEIDHVGGAISGAGIRRTRAGARHLLGCAAVAQLARDPRFLRIVSGILGCEPFPFRATLFEKSVASNWLVAWHQDTALPLRRRFNETGWGPWSVKAGVFYSRAPASALSTVVALRVHLDDSSATNGPLRVLPGTHLLGVLTDEMIRRLAGSIEAVECLVPRGGVLAMWPLLVHSSSRCLEPSPRRVLHIEYARSPIIGPGIELAVA